MSEDFYRVTLDDDEFMIINRAFIVQVIPDSDATKGFIVYLDKSSATVSRVDVKQKYSKRFLEWLLDVK